MVLCSKFVCFFLSFFLSFINFIFDRTIPGVTRFEFNLYEDAIQSMDDYFKNLMVFLDGEKGFAKGYMVILESGKRLIGNVFRYMIKELSIHQRNSIIIHCTAGKDRTGIFIMILLGLCGVDDEIIAREYELTNLGHFGILLFIIAVVKIDFYLLNSSIILDFEKDLETRANKLGVTIENMRSALSAR